MARAGDDDLAGAPGADPDDDGDDVLVDRDVELVGALLEALGRGGAVDEIGAVVNRARAISATVSMPLPDTSPTTNPNRSSPMSTMLYQSPPISTPADPATYDVATSSCGMVGMTWGSSARCSRRNSSR